VYAGPDEVCNHCCTALESSLDRCEPKSVLLVSTFASLFVVCRSSVLFAPRALYLSLINIANPTLMCK
jgi:hypothetical protein